MTTDEKIKRRGWRLMKSQGLTPVISPCDNEPLDREEIVNLRVAKELESVRVGMVVYDRVLALQVHAMDCVESIGAYLVKLSQAGFLRAKGLAGRYEKVK